MKLSVKLAASVLFVLLISTSNAKDCTTLVTDTETAIAALGEIVEPAFLATTFTVYATKLVESEPALGGSTDLTPGLAEALAEALAAARIAEAAADFAASRTIFAAFHLATTDTSVRLDASHAAFLAAQVAVTAERSAGMLDELASARPPHANAEAAGAFVYFAEFARDDAAKTSSSAGTAATILSRALANACP